MGLRTVVLTGLAVLGVAAPAQAATFQVTTTTDIVGGPSGCTVLPCTLRNALSAAAGNGVAEDDLIVLREGVYTLNPQLGALPAATTRLTVQGAGANTTSIEPPASTRAMTVAGSAAVTLTGLTLRGGSAASGQGGNLFVNSQAAVTLDRVRITGGSAPQGGGIGVLGAASLTIQSSLIDGNTATGTTTSAAGGGIYLFGQTQATAITIQDSTLTGNSAGNGGAIAIENNVGQVPVLRGVTMVRNRARAVSPVAGIGGISSAATSARFQGSIVAGNTRTVNFGGGSADQPASCGLSAPAIDDGGNVTPTGDDQCNLGGVHEDPLLAGALDETQEPPVLAIPENSPAVDVADCAGRTVDQRGVARPQLSACDAGAFEFQPPPPEETPTPTATPTTTPEPTATPAVTPTATPAVTPTPTPGPVAGKSVGADPVSGTVLVKLPGSKRFVKLDPSVIKNGAEVDARKGVVEITRSDGGVAKFYAGIFKLSQANGITTLTLTEKLTGCPKAKKSSARAAARKPKTRKLWGDGKGKFRTKGSYSAATVRGTKWLTQDTCTTTLTRVTEGVVSVNDLVKKKTLLRRKGQRYTARARR